MVKLKMTTNLLKWTSPVGKLSRSHSTFMTGIMRNSPPKHWIHDTALLVNGHVAYLVKFLGSSEVTVPRGTDIIKDTIKKLEFQEHLKRSEGEKIKRLELAISIDGIAIREPKTKQNIHQFPLKHISYCAEETSSKSDRKYLSFIVITDKVLKRHECFVFVSDKLSEEITFTIGQAFDLAYRKFLEEEKKKELEADKQLDGKKELDPKEELEQARKRIKELERKVTELEQKLQQNERPESKSHLKHLPTPPITPVTNQSIDLTEATNKLQSLIDLP